jgi:4-amino-4-deoxy-L-arabinose transferase-like glycosyltransferase
VGAHFLSDVVGGAYLGFVCGWVICRFSPQILQATSRIVEKRKDLLAAGAVLIFAGVLFFNQLGAVGLFDLDEAVFSEASREMVETGNFITPLYNYAYRYDKPILFYWLMSTSFFVFGINEFSARFWSALAGCGLVLVTFLFARTVGNLRSAVFSAVILATSIEMLILAHAAITDMVLTFFISSALFCFFMASQEPTPGLTSAWKAKWVLWGWTAVAAAVLTKGPIGILFPMGITFLFLWATGRLRQGIRLLAIGPGILLFCAITLPWYIAESVMTRGEFLQAFFLKHNVARYLSVNSGHRGPVFYYLLVIAVGLFPWSGFLPAAVWSAWKLRKNDLPLFILLWMGGIFLFFSFSSTKLPNYVAPLFPALCLLVGWWWDRLLSQVDTPMHGGIYQASEASVRGRLHPALPVEGATQVPIVEQVRGVRLSVACGLVLSLLFAVALVFIPFVFKMVQSRLSSVPYLADPLDLGILPFLLAGSVAFIATGYFFFLKKENRLESFVVLASSMVLFSLILFGGLLPKVGRYIQDPLRHLTRLAVERAAPKAPVVVLGLNNPSILFYARRPATIIGGDDVTTLRSHLGRPDPVFILTKASLAERYKEEPGFYPIERRGGYVLVSNRPGEGSP